MVSISTVARMAVDGQVYFVKWGDAASAAMVEAESFSLQRIAETNTVVVPQVIAAGQWEAAVLRSALPELSRRFCSRRAAISPPSLLSRAVGTRAGARKQRRGVHALAGLDVIGTFAEGPSHANVELKPGRLDGAQPGCFAVCTQELPAVDQKGRPRPRFTCWSEPG
ncbi:MAG: fructosamine kinase family protein [Aquincola sp.]|nr:fructosamine kinase family protein [Aquincola sp.]